MPSSGSEIATRPTANQIEISVFGPGYGECIVAHLGENDWIVVDSCLDKTSGRPVAIHYLSSIGVDIATQVRRIIVTHWDDDHINGISETFKQCTAAKLVVSSAFTHEQFFAILAAWKPSAFISGGSGIQEMDDLYRELVSRRLPGHSTITAIPASENKELFSRTGTLPVLVKSLAPSDAGVLAALARFNEIRAKATGRGRLPKIEDNHASVVMTIQVGGINLLLEGDLQVRADRSYGWLAIVDSDFAIKHEMQKAAHHGSENGSCPEVWEKLLAKNPLTVITPFINGDVILPTLEDCKRFSKLTNRAYLTAPPVARSFRDPDREAEKAIKEEVLSVRSSPSIFGHVRLRRVLDKTSDWTVELFKDALSLEKLLAEL